jgi:phosphoadenosine phosphosulfate reductase
MSGADVWRDGRFEADPWVIVGDDAELPDVPAIVSLTRLVAGVAVPAERLGVLLQAADAVEELAPLLARVSLVAVTFPKFNDGRGFSQARLLADRYGFTGEIRAVGDVLLDQIPLMRRVGITAFKVTNSPTRSALAAGHLPDVAYHYQPATDTPPTAGRRFIGAR